MKNLRASMLIHPENHASSHDNVSSHDIQKLNQSINQWKDKTKLACREVHWPSKSKNAFVKLILINFAMTILTDILGIRCHFLFYECEHICLVD